jgi:hypothetical protein
MAVECLDIYNEIRGIPHATTREVLKRTLLISRHAILIDIAKIEREIDILPSVAWIHQNVAFRVISLPIPRNVNQYR